MSQLLSSSAVWDGGDVDLHTSRRILGVFNTAAITVVQQESTYDSRLPTVHKQGLGREEWLKAVVDGADEKSPRWRHLLLLGGILLGFDGQDRQGLPLHLRKKLESALVKAVHLALDELDEYPKIAGYTIALVLNYTFELLSDLERGQIDYDRLLPILVEGVFFSSDGLESAYFLGVIDQDVREVQGKRFAWSEQSATFRKTNAILSKPLVASLGPVSRLIAHAVENAHDQGLAIQVVGQLLQFSRTLTVQWRQNKLSEIDASEEAEFLDENSVQTTIPALWRLLKASLFSVTIVLRAVLGRVLNDAVLGSDKCERILPKTHVINCYETDESSFNRCATHRERYYAHPPKYVLYNRANRPERVVAIYICQPGFNRHSFSVPPALRAVFGIYQASRERADSCSPC